MTFFKVNNKAEIFYKILIEPAIKKSTNNNMMIKKEKKLRHM